MTKRLISIILVLFTMFSLSAATVVLVEPNGKLYYHNKLSINNELGFKFYDSFAYCLAFDATNTKTTFYKDGSFKVEYTDTDGSITSLKFDANEKDEIKSFADLCEAYTMLHIQRKLLK